MENLSEKIHISGEVIQGGTILPIIFLIFLAPLLKILELKKKTISIIALITVIGPTSVKRDYLQN